MSGVNKFAPVGVAGDAVLSAHENAPGGQGGGSGGRNYQRRRRKKQWQKRGRKRANERVLRELRVERRFHTLRRTPSHELQPWAAAEGKKGQTDCNEGSLVTAPR